jgi:hypothetical protein
MATKSNTTWKTPAQGERAYKGILVIKSYIDPDIVMSIKRQFNAFINSVSNSWRMPVFGVGPKNRKKPKKKAPRCDWSLAYPENRCSKPATWKAPGRRIKEVAHCLCDEHKLINTWRGSSPYTIRIK